MALAAFLTTRSDEEPPDGPIRGEDAEEPSPNSISKLDPIGEQLDFTRSDLPGPSQAAAHDLEAGAGSVWLVRSPNIVKIDPEDGSSVPVRGLSGLTTNGIDVSELGVWIVGGALYEVDPATGVAGDPVDFLPPDVPAPTTANDVAAGFGSVWVSLSQGEVIRVDPDTARTVEIEVGDAPEALAAGSDALWVLDEAAGAVWRIDPRTGRVLRAIPVSGGLDGLAIGEGFVWVLDTALGTVTPIDEASGEVHSAIDVGSDAEDVAVGLGSVWVASGGDVLEISPLTLRVERTIDVADVAILQLTVDTTDGSIWLDFSTSAVR